MYKCTHVMCSVELICVHVYVFVYCNCLFPNFIYILVHELLYILSCEMIDAWAVYVYFEFLKFSIFNSVRKLGMQCINLVL